MPPGSDEARAITASIEEARSKGGLTASPAATGKTVSGQVDLSTELKSKVKAGDVLMVIARQPGERMPVAVLKTPIAEFPMSFSLTDALAMNPSMPLSQLSSASIEVRISKTGMAMPEAGDLISSPQTVKVGTSNIRLLVDQVRQ